MFAGMLMMFSMLETYRTRPLNGYIPMKRSRGHPQPARAKGVTASDATGDGYSLTIKKNYESYAQELKDRAKENGEPKDAMKGHRRRLFAYTFTIMDLNTRLAHGSSTKSERGALDKGMLSCMGVELDSMRLDRYYSYPTYVDMFGNAKVYVIPKKNSTLNGPEKWKEAMKEFVKGMGYFEQYHLRSNSEAGFAADKKMLGWGVAQRREDRINSALFCIGLWHNLFNMGR